MTGVSNIKDWGAVTGKVAGANSVGYDSDKVSTAADAEIAVDSINALLVSVNKIAGLGGGRENPVMNSASENINNLAARIVTAIANTSSKQSYSEPIYEGKGTDVDPGNQFSFH